MTRLRGVVRSGKDDFSYWIKRLEQYYREKTGMTLFPGTLNVHLMEGDAYRTPPNCIRLENHEYGGHVSVSIIPCTVFDRPAYILRTDTDDGKHGDPPEKILEIATDVNLRDLTGLKDGDVIEVEVLDQPIGPSTV